MTYLHMLGTTLPPLGPVFVSPGSVWFDSPGEGRLPLIDAECHRKQSLLGPKIGRKTRFFVDGMTAY